MASPAPIIWFEIRTPDVDAAKRFYGQLLGWRFRAMDDYDDAYWLVEPAPGLGGAILPAAGDAPAASAGTVVYVQVDDLRAAVRTTAHLGGTVHEPPTAIPDGTSFAVVRDPQGQLLGLWADQPL